MKRYTVYTVCLLLLAVACQPKHTNKTKPTEVQSFARTFKKYPPETHFMGSVEIADQTRVRFTKHQGFEQLTRGVPIGNSSTFKIGSVSKIFTAVLLLKAYEKKMLTLETPLTAFFPENRHWKNIQVKMLLQHQSGIHNFTADSSFFSYRETAQTQQMLLGKISNFPLDFTPGHSTEYSNSNYFLLALILEKLYQQPYAALIKSEIITPLKLRHTFEGTTITAAAQPNSYTYTSHWTLFPPTHLSIPLGSGSLCSNPSDLNRFLSALFEGKLLQQNTLALMLSARQQFGLGIKEYVFNDQKAWGHMGSIDGFKTAALYFPKQKIALSVCSNGTANNFDQFLQELTSEFFNRPQLQISQQQLLQYTGRYQDPTDPKHQPEFSAKNGILYLHLSDFKDPLRYKGAHEFVLDQIHANPIHFVFDTKNNQLTFKQGTFQCTMKKQEQG